jgi:glycine/D-amino acid oxidase-like deaminating enzyme/nitrite reductase/ring-hydroxylating ferredoxin subunit
MTIPDSTRSFWVATAPGRSFPPLPGDLRVDVAIVGGGITGITAALLLKRAGKRVAVLEAQRVGEGVTGYTTAHLTEAIDARYATLIGRFGLEGAKLAARASRAGIERIAAFVRELGIDCGFQRLPGYLYTERDGDLGALHDEYEAARKVGLAVTMSEEVPLPFKARAGVRFEDQAQFHVRKYVMPLAEAVAGDGCHVFEDTRVEAVHHELPCRIETPRGTVHADHVIVAANVPLNRLFLQTKIAHYRSYAIAARTTQLGLKGLFWDTDDPYHYLRSATAGGEDVVVIGGEDHKTGQEEDTVACYVRLVAYARERFAVTAIRYRWSAQVIEPVDGLPFIGRNSLSSHVFVATGYSGNGMTFGTMAGMLLVDEVLGRANPWASLFDATRIKPLASARDFIAENVDFPLHLVGDRLRRPDAKDVADVKAGEGKIVAAGGERLAVFRRDDGGLHVVSAICPHLGCQVHFNNAERTWDCPCHGSRFATDGELLNGPATCGLAPRALDEEEPAPAKGAPSHP